MSAPTTGILSAASRLAFRALITSVHARPAHLDEAVVPAKQTVTIAVRKFKSSTADQRPDGVQVSVF
jgi:hypothetical protein